ncbi:MAG: TFIIB-type zinc ribbon-containing protein [Halobacteriaceae archaeon]
MEIRGQRKCQSCGERWSYYDTGSVTCPACGSIRSVGVDERTQHTDGTVTLDLTAARAAAAEDDFSVACEEAKTACAAYTRVRGFIDAGRFRPLDEVFVAAHELRRAARTYDRMLRPDDEDTAYLLALLSGAPDGDRPDSETVTDRLRPARGLGAATAVDAYLREFATWRADAQTAPGLDGPLGRLRAHVRRIKALDGDVPVADTDRLVGAARALGEYASSGEESDRETAVGHLDALG